MRALEGRRRRYGTALGEGASVTGPAIVELPHRTVAIAPAQRLVHHAPNLVCYV